MHPVKRIHELTLVKRMLYARFKRIYRARVINVHGKMSTIFLPTWDLYMKPKPGKCPMCGHHEE